jgi:hypothetical protein
VNKGIRQATQKSLKWKLFNFVMVLIVIFVLYGYLGRHAINVMDSVEQASDKQSVIEFIQSLSAIHSKWLLTKDSVISLPLVDVLEVQISVTGSVTDAVTKKSNTESNHKNVLSFKVNEFGWPINIVTHRNINKAYEINKPKSGSLTEQKKHSEKNFSNDKSTSDIRIYKSKKINNRKIVDCMALWHNMQSQKNLKTVSANTVFDNKNKIVACAYFNSEKKMFVYNLYNGKVDTVILY